MSIFGKQAINCKTAKRKNPAYMAKGQNAQKKVKKAATKTAKEKKAEKRLKKAKK